MYIAYLVIFGNELR